MSSGPKRSTLRYRVVAPFQRRIANPIARRWGRSGLLPGQALIETVGRKTGQPRQTPVGGRLIGHSFWLVSEFGMQSQYVRNIVANPHVRVRFANQWHRGTARVMRDDDARARLRKLRPINSLLVRAAGNELTTVRVDLDDARADRAAPCPLALRGTAYEFHDQYRIKVRDHGPPRRRGR
ncbi:nitroreductase/quinone reductase family protein [Georgenia deserti]|uniref:Nitroreductase/quinone reductase family protein n=1 Tax=Georgenia deserti TaxID=2093781 RepID=A0ABW4KXZ4_9MICO